MRLTARLLLLLGAVAAATAQAQISHFKHVVIIFQENRTPDNLFQGLCAAPYGACAVPPTPSAPYDIQTSNWATAKGREDSALPGCVGQHLRSESLAQVVQLDVRRCHRATL